MKRPLSLRVRILLSCLACMVGAMLIQLTLFTRSSSQIISAQVETINANTLANLGDDLYERVKAVENSLIAIYEHKDFLRALALEDVTSLAETYASLAYTMAYERLSRPNISTRSISIPRNTSWFPPTGTHRRPVIPIRRTSMMGPCPARTKA